MTDWLCKKFLLFIAIRVPQKLLARKQGLHLSLSISPPHSPDFTTIMPAEEDSRYLYVLPVLFYEYLAIALSKSLLPGMMVDYFGDWTYYTIGIIETVKGILAFVACPIFGKLSDVIGRRRCLLMTVLGTTMPVCSLAFTSNLWVFVAVMSASGIFAATFPLTFAYIADYVPASRRAPAYGLALATFGLSFSIGPVAGGYLAKMYGAETVFAGAVLLVLVDVAYILFVLPESRDVADGPGGEGPCGGSGDSHSTFTAVAARHTGSVRAAAVATSGIGKVSSGGRPPSVGHGNSSNGWPYGPFQANSRQCVFGCRSVLQG
ncbi:unnamed protein product [Phaeothamnion confervicola]